MLAITDDTVRDEDVGGDWTVPQQDYRHLADRWK